MVTVRELVEGKAAKGKIEPSRLAGGRHDFGRVAEMILLHVLRLSGGGAAPFGFGLRKVRV